ncbi:hypothetical protein LINPERPRIM_LOCUS32745 [Linum perenne]
MANPNRRFFGCPRYKSKNYTGCGFFEWFDIRVALDKERHKVADMVGTLHLHIEEIEEEKRELQYYPSLVVLWI